MFIRLQIGMVVATVLVFLTLNAVNEWLFTQLVALEFTHGINWVFLPAGARLLCTLLFGTAGAVGLLLSGLLLNFYHFSFVDPMRALMGAIAGSMGPYLVYRYAARAYGLQASLVNLTSRRLLFLIGLCSVASPLFHHLWFALSSPQPHLMRSFVAMFVGDLNGTLIVVYTIKGLLSFLPTSKSNDGANISPKLRAKL